MKKKWFYILLINYLIAITVVLRLIFIGQIMFPFENLLGLLNSEKYFEVKAFIIKNEITKYYPGKRAYFTVILTGHLIDDSTNRKVVLNNTNYVAKITQENKILVYKNNLNNSIFMTDNKSIQSAYFDSIFKIYFIISFIITTILIIFKLFTK